MTPSSVRRTVFGPVVGVVSGFGRVRSDCEVVVVVSVGWLVVQVFAIDFVVVSAVVIQWKQVWTPIANQGPVVVCYRWQVESVALLVNFVGRWQLVVIQ